MMPRQRAAENKNTPGYDAQFKNDGGAAFASNLVSLKLVELFCQLIVDGVCAGQQRLFWVLSASLGDRIDHVAAAVVRYAGEDRREFLSRHGFDQSTRVRFRRSWRRPAPRACSMAVGP